MSEPVVDYDSKGDSLYVSLRTAKYSIEFGEYIIDVDSKNFVSGIEILNASVNLGVPKKYLNSIKEAKFVVNYKPQLLAIMLYLKYIKQDVVQQSSLNATLSVDLGRKIHTDAHKILIPQ